jgi:hypothetical protein
MMMVMATVNPHLRRAASPKPHCHESTWFPINRNRNRRPAVCASEVWVRREISQPESYRDISLIIFLDSVRSRCRPGVSSALLIGTLPWSNGSAALSSPSSSLVRTSVGDHVLTTQPWLQRPARSDAERHLARWSEDCSHTKMPRPSGLQVIRCQAVFTWHS